jgi:hypothetical protein
MAILRYEKGNMVGRKTFRSASEDQLMTRWHVSDLFHDTLAYDMPPDNVVVNCI